MTLAALTAGAALGALALRPAVAAGAADVTFPFNDGRYLVPGFTQGGLAHVTPGVVPGSPAPLVVFLHGTNARKKPHPWLGGTEWDLRPVADDRVLHHGVTPFVLAGPTQTKDAVVPETMWPAFDLDAFVAAVEKALGPGVVDRKRVILLGHSGAGCNRQGGMMGAVSRIVRRPAGGEASPSAPVVPLAFVAVDTCMDVDVAQSLARALTLPAPAPAVRVYFQRVMWPRTFDAFRALLPAEELQKLSPPAHEFVLPAAMGRALGELLAKPAD